MSFLPEYSSDNRDKCFADSARRKSYLCFLIGLFSQFVIAETEYLFILAMCFSWKNKQCCSLYTGKLLLSCPHDHISHVSHLSQVTQVSQVIPWDMPSNY